MTDIHRFYKCGCHLDAEEFCDVMYRYVWEDRDAAMSWSLNDFPEREKELLRQMEVARVQCRIHIGWQEAAGLYEDVDFDAPEMQPPDDGGEPQSVVNP